MGERGPGNPEFEQALPEAVRETSQEVKETPIQRENEPARSQRLDIIELKPDDTYRHHYDIEEVRTLNHKGQPLEIRRDHRMTPKFGMPQDMPTDTRQEFQYDESGRLTTEKFYSHVGEIEGFVNNKGGMQLRGEGRAAHDPETGVVRLEYYRADGTPTGRHEVRSKDGSVRMLYDGEKLVGRIFEERGADGKVTKRTTLGEDGKVEKVEEFNYEKATTSIVEKNANGNVKGRTIEVLRTDHDLLAEKAEQQDSEGQSRTRVHRKKGLSDFQRDERGDPSRWGGWGGSGLGF
jgi:hypothetical protein